MLPQKSDDLVEQLLINRGIKTAAEKEKFFNPRITDYESDLKVPGIPKAVKRIQKAIAEGEMIIAFGDYDVDGIAGAAVLYLGLTAAGAKVLPYIPHREKEGYGLSKQGLDFARDSGASIVITTDCGIVNFEEAEYAKQLGLDLIITDHHQPDKKLPEAFEIIHSTKMCGAAVSWCLVREITPLREASSKPQDLVDLVAIATISDMMPLVGINRALVYEGLKKLNRSDRVGLLALFSEADVKLGEIDAYTVGHVIAPRLNAMGRLEHAIDSLRLLCTKDPDKARRLTDLISQTNEARKVLTSQAVEEAKLMVNSDLIGVNGSKKKINVLSSETWSQGIIGLVAGRICDETGCSTVAISVSGEFSKGSARSRNGVNIIETLRECSDLLVAVGGHKGAAGFTIETSKITIFRERLEGLLDGQEIVDQELEIEAEVVSNKLNFELVKKIATFEPFGISNQKPVLATNNLVLSDLRTVGEGKHLKGKADGIDFIGFGMGKMESLLKNGDLINLAYTLEINRFNGSEKLQLKVVDLKID